MFPAITWPVVFILPPGFWGATRGSPLTPLQCHLQMPSLGPAWLPGAPLFSGLSIHALTLYPQTHWHRLFAFPTVIWLYELSIEFLFFQLFTVRSSRLAGLFKDLWSHHPNGIYTPTQVHFCQVTVPNVRTDMSLCLAAFSSTRW